VSRTASILGVEPALLDELWRRKPLQRVIGEYPGGRLAASCRLLQEAGADDGGPLAEGAREVSPPQARAIFEALCAELADGVWDVPGWALRPFVDVAAILAHGRTPYPAGFEPDGFSTPELFLWLDGRDDAALDAARTRVARAEREIQPGEDAALQRDVCESVAALLERAGADGLLVLIEHPQGL
jgi:hypothetical protein